MTKNAMVYVDFLPLVQKDLERMARKAKKYNVPFSYEISPVVEKVKVDVYTADHWTRTKDYSFYTDGVSVTINYEPIKANGWTVIAKIEAIPDTERRIVSMVSQEEPREEWFGSDMHCDHCNTSRARNCVFICRHEDGREVQVGKSCLMEYTGINPLSVLSGAEITDIINDCNADLRCCIDDFHPSRRYWETDVIIALADDIIREHGYVKSDLPGSTKGRLEKALLSHVEPSDNAVARAELIRDWLMTRGIRDMSLEYNARALVEAGYADTYHLGYLAYLPVAYDKALEWEAQRRTALEADMASQYVGEVGKRIELHPISAKIVTGWETQWGYTYIWKITDESGNVYTWKTAKGGSIDPDQLPTTIKGTVKAHTEYQGVCQTELTRCKCIA